MRIAIAGCGYVSDYYAGTLPLHPELKVVGVLDRIESRAARYAALHAVRQYRGIDELLEDGEVEAVVNLTGPFDHYEVTKASLEAGKHVYSEKPLAMSMPQACELVTLAETRGLHLSSAPCSLLGEAAQTLWKALREEVVGKVRVVYAEIDDGMVHLMAYRTWVSRTGAAWPAKSEFEVGCTMEHAGYYLAWLPAFFGPAEEVVAFASCQIPDKLTDEPIEEMAPDFSVACIRFRSGVVARLTNSVIAPHDHSLRIIGDEGILRLEECWNYKAPVYVKKRLRWRGRTRLSPIWRRVPLVGRHLPKASYGANQHMDFCRGIAELAEAVAQGRPCRLSARYCLHVNEVALAIHEAAKGDARVRVNSRWDAVQPMEWGK
jgi:predicted dehydrogenase